MKQQRNDESEIYYFLVFCNIMLASIALPGNMAVFFYFISLIKFTLLCHELFIAISANIVHALQLSQLHLLLPICNPLQFFSSLSGQFPLFFAQHQSSHRSSCQALLKKIIHEEHPGQTQTNIDFRFLPPTFIRRTVQGRQNNFKTSIS